MLKDNLSSISKNIKKSPLFSNWRLIVFLGIVVFLIFLIRDRFDFIAFINSVKSLDLLSFIWLILISLFEQLVSWFRYMLFLDKPKLFDFMKYIVVTSAANVIPPKPLGVYYRFIFSLQLFKESVKKTSFLIAIDTFFESFFIFIFALFGLILFPNENLGLEVLIYSIAIFGIIYLVFSYYETKYFIIKNKFFKLLVEYFIKIKKKVFISFVKFLKQNKLNIFYGSIFTIIKMFLGVLKIYLLFEVFGISVSFWLCFGIWSIAYLVGTASSLPGGLGAFELSFVYLSEASNISGVVALNVALLERVSHIWVWAIISLIYLLHKKIGFAKAHTYFIKLLSGFADELEYKKTKNRLEYTYYKFSNKIKKIKRPAKKLVKVVSKNLKKL